MNRMQNSALMCQNCNGVLDVNPSKIIAKCKFCGTCYSVSGLLGESDEVKIAKINAHVYNKFAKDYFKTEKLRLKVEKMRLKNEEAAISDALKYNLAHFKSEVAEKRQREQAEVQARSEQYATAYKRSFFSKLIIFFLFAIYIFFGAVCSLPVDGQTTGFFVAGVAAIQCLCLVFAVMMGKQVIRTKNPYSFRIPVYISLILIIPFFIAFAYHTDVLYENRKQAEILEKQQETNLEFDWDELVLGDVLSKPSSSNGEINYNQNDEFDVDVYKISPKEFYDYVENCKSLGFTVEMTESTYFFNAYNQGGYKVNIYYYSSWHEGEMSIQLDAPMDFSEVHWTEIKLAEKIPSPQSNMGNISSNYDSHLCIYIGDITKEDYNAYVGECVEFGYEVDATAKDNSYKAYNPNGDCLEVSFVEFGMMKIDLALKVENIDI